MSDTVRIDFQLYDESGLYWMGPDTLGGYPIHEYVNFMLEGGDELTPLLDQGLCMPIGMYGDGGSMNLRVALGELAENEASEWTARATGKLDLSCGRMLIGSSCDSDNYFDHKPARDAKELKGTDDLGHVDVPPDTYRVDVYSYPPRDMSSTWESIVSEDSWAGTHPEAEPLRDYFNRTRSGQPYPYWIAYDLQEIDFQAFNSRREQNPMIDFLIHLTPLRQPLPAWKLSADGQTLDWEPRKPERCPLGIPMHGR